MSHRRGVNGITPFCDIDRLLEIQPGPFLISLILQNPVRKRANLMAMAMRKRGHGRSPVPRQHHRLQEEVQAAVPIACSTRARSDCANKASSRETATAKNRQPTHIASDGRVIQDAVRPVELGQFHGALALKEPRIERVRLGLFQVDQTHPGQETTAPVVIEANSIRRGRDHVRSQSPGCCWNETGTEHPLNAGTHKILVPAPLARQAGRRRDRAYAPFAKPRL